MNSLWYEQSKVRIVHEPYNLPNAKIAWRVAVEPGLRCRLSNLSVVSQHATTVSAVGMIKTRQGMCHDVCNIYDMHVSEQWPNSTAGQRPLILVRSYKPSGTTGESSTI